MEATQPLVWQVSSPGIFLKADLSHLSAEDRAMVERITKETMEKIERGLARRRKKEADPTPPPPAI